MTISSCRLNIRRKSASAGKSGIRAKKGIISSIKSIDDEQDTEITYFFGQELTNNRITLEEYIEKIENVTKEKIIEIAKSITINTIYFLKNNDATEEVQ